MPRMPNIASALKSEIQRLARKELRGAVQQLHKLVSQQRSAIAALRRRLSELESGQKAITRKQTRSAVASDPEGKSDLRFRAGGFATLRKKLGLSAKDMGALIGVSGLSIYKWESGTTKPRRKQLEAIAAVRSLGKREAAKRLEDLAASDPGQGGAAAKSRKRGAPKKRAVRSRR